LAAKNNLDTAAQELVKTKATCEPTLDAAKVAHQATAKTWATASASPTRSDVDGFGGCDVPTGEANLKKTQIGANTTFVHLKTANVYKLVGKEYPVHTAALFRSPVCGNVVAKPSQHRDNIAPIRYEFIAPAGQYVVMFVACLCGLLRCGLGIVYADAASHTANALSFKARVYVLVGAVDIATGMVARTVDACPLCLVASCEDGVRDVFFHLRLHGGG
jgi:hypothetical protein